MRRRRATPTMLGGRRRESMPAGMAGQATPRASCSTALGTLVGWPPAPRLRARLRARTGVEIGADEAGRAMRAEIAFYRAHLDAGRDAAGAGGAARVRRRRRALGRRARRDPLTEALLAALRFSPFPDAVPALSALRLAGMRARRRLELGRLAARGAGRRACAPCRDGASSAEVGAPKPDPAIFARALALAGAAPADALARGRHARADVAGARAAGIAPVLIDRDGTLEAPPGGAPDLHVGRAAGALPRNLK